MRTASAIVTIVVLNFIGTSTSPAAIVPMSHMTSVSVQTDAGTAFDDDGATGDSLDPFSETVTGGVANAQGTASATATLTSDISNVFGGVSVTGGTATASTGAGNAAALTTFTYTFRVTDEVIVARLSAAIAQTGTGDVLGRLADITGPAAGVYLYSAHFSPVISEGSPTIIQDVLLQAGHTYDLSFIATSDDPGTTSFSAQLNPVPEPAVTALLAPAAALLMRRRSGALR